MLWCPVELLKRRAEHPECTVVEAEPDVQSVLLDSSPLPAVAPARALATESPAALVDGHLEALTQFGSGQLERRRDRCGSTAKHGNFRARLRYRAHPLGWYPIGRVYPR